MYEPARDSANLRFPGKLSHKNAKICTYTMTKYLILCLADLWALNYLFHPPCSGTF